MKINTWLRRLKEEFTLIRKANDINARYLDIPAKENRVNIFQYHPDRFYSNSSQYNLGDSLGEVIIDFLLKQKGVEIDKHISKKKHLYCVGTNIHGAYQDATIWGSGCFYPLQGKFDFLLQKIARRKLDIRAVRGPLTREILIKKFNHKCPEVYGDPAILMPLIYNPIFEKEYEYLIIPQFLNEKNFREKHHNERMITMNTNDYKNVIDEIKKSKIVYSSSLHGIILAEAYGIPAVFFRSLSKDRDFKYYDWYYSTNRYDIKLVDTLEEAKKTTPPPIPDLTKLQQGLLDSFPYDLWEI